MYSKVQRCGLQVRNLASPNRNSFSFFPSSSFSLLLLLLLHFPHFHFVVVVVLLVKHTFRSQVRILPSPKNSLLLLPLLLLLLVSSGFFSLRDVVFQLRFRLRRIAMDPAQPEARVVGRHPSPSGRRPSPCRPHPLHPAVP